MSTLQKIGTLFEKRDRLGAVLLFLSMIVNALLEALGIGLIIPILTVINEPERLSDYGLYEWWTQAANTTSRETLLIVLCAITFGVYALKNLYATAHAYWMYRYMFRREVRVSRRLFFSLLTRPYAFFLHTNSSSLLRMLNEEIRLSFDGVVLPATVIAVEMVMVVRHLHVARDRRSGRRNRDGHGLFHGLLYFYQALSTYGISRRT